MEVSTKDRMPGYKQLLNIDDDKSGLCLSIYHTMPSLTCSQYLPELSEGQCALSLSAWKTSYVPCKRDVCLQSEELDACAMAPDG